VSHGKAFGLGPLEVEVDVAPDRPPINAQERRAFDEYGSALAAIAPIEYFDDARRRTAQT